MDMRSPAFASRTAKIAMALGLCALVAACGSTASSNGAAAGSGRKQFAGMSLVVAGEQSNINSAIENDGFDAKFTQETGATIDWITGSAPGNLAKMVASRGGTPPYDVAFLDNTTELEAAQAGVIQKITPSTQLPDVAADLPSGAYPVPGYGPAWIVIRLGSCVNTAAYSAHNIQLPTGINGWFDPSVAGYTTLPASSNFFWGDAMAGIAQNYGVNPPFANPTPVIAQFKKAKVQSWNTSSTVAETDLTNGTVWLTALTDGRCLGLKLQNQPVSFLPLNLHVDGKTYAYAGEEDVVDIASGISKKMTALAAKFVDLVEGPLGVNPLVSQFDYLPANTKLQAQAEASKAFKDTSPPFSYASMYIPSISVEKQFLAASQAWVSAWNQAGLGA